MKKITIHIVMALLCLNFKAQAQDNKAVDITLKGIQIGQKVPDITITNLHNYKNANGKPATTAKLSDFKGKLLILDFWATWCSPCVAMIPKMDSLQKSFGNKIQFLSVTYQTEKEVLPFLDKLEKQMGRQFELAHTVEDTVLRQMFPHRALPHYVWLDGNAKVVAITDHVEVNATNINNALKDKSEMVQKRDIRIAYDHKRPFLLGGNGGDGSNVLFHSILTGYADGLAAGYTYDLLDSAKAKPRKVSCWNKSIAYLFRIAYQGDTNRLAANRVVLEVADKLKVNTSQVGKELRKWRTDNTYCYELIVPPVRSADLFKLMERDLSELFPQYWARMEPRIQKCLVLERTSGVDKLKTNGQKPFAEVESRKFKMQNADLGYFVAQLERLYIGRHEMPIKNATSYSGKVDMELSANLLDIPNLNSALAKYDLRLVEKEAVMEMLVISDNNKTIRP